MEKEIPKYFTIPLGLAFFAGGMLLVYVGGILIVGKATFNSKSKT